MYELIVLSLLMVFSGIHGYSIMKIANDAIGPWVKISSGTLYPLLTKLEQTGLILRAEYPYKQGQEDRHSHTFMITETGRQRFHQLMMDTSSNLGDYQRIFYLKMIFMYLMTVDERFHLLDHYINYCQISLLHCRSEARDFSQSMATQSKEDPFDRTAALAVMQHKEKFWQAEADWVLQIREQLAAEKRENPPESP